MTGNVSGRLRRIRVLEDEVELGLELAKRRLEFGFAVHGGKVRFEQAVLSRRSAMKTHRLRHALGARPVMQLTAPLIYGMLAPLARLDLFLINYEAIRFRVYGSEKVRRTDYLVFDRTKLDYLNAVEKLKSAYCSYANGLISCLREIAGRTERY